MAGASLTQDGSCGVEFTWVGTAQNPVAHIIPVCVPGRALLITVHFCPSATSTHFSPVHAFCLAYHPPNMASISQSIKNLTAVTPKAKALSQNDNDVVIVAAVRSAITKVRILSGLTGS